MFSRFSIGNENTLLFKGLISASEYLFNGLLSKSKDTSRMFVCGVLDGGAVGQFAYGNRERQGEGVKVVRSGARVIQKAELVAPLYLYSWCLYNERLLTCWAVF